MREERQPARMMRKCPRCAYYAHFNELTEQECRHCGEITDFARFRPTEQKAVLWTEACFDALLAGLIEKPSLSRHRSRSGWVLALSLPIILFWLIACNSLDIRPLPDAPPLVNTTLNW